MAHLKLLYYCVVFAVSVSLPFWAPELVVKLTGQEREANSLKVWRIVQQGFESRDFPPRTVEVYKFQVGDRAVCRAVVYGYAGLASLGDVPCGQ